MTVRLVCNVCRTEREGQVGWGIAKLREALARVGWSSNARLDRDYCPRCLGEADVRARSAR